MLKLLYILHKLLYLLLRVISEYNNILLYKDWKPGNCAPNRYSNTYKAHPLACYILSLSATTKHKNVAKRRLATERLTCLSSPNIYKYTQALILFGILSLTRKFELKIYHQSSIFISYTSCLIWPKKH